MANKDAEFLKKLLETFRVEAEEHVKSLSTGLIELEKASVPERQLKILESLFREAHSLKGAARAVNLTEIELVCQSLESVFFTLRQESASLSPHLLDMLHQAVDTIGKLVTRSKEAPKDKGQFEITTLIQNLEAASLSPAVSQQSPEITHHEQRPLHEVQPAIPALADTVRISVAKLDSLLLEAEEFLSAKLAVSQRNSEVRELTAAVSAWKKEWSKIRNRVSGARLSTLQWAECLESNDSFIKLLEGKLSTLAKAANHDQRSVGAMVDNLLEDVKKVLMLPFSSLSEIFPKFVRDLSRDQGKEVDLVIQGGEIEIDRRILEEMKDPLIHLVRNCIDHGIEKSQERKQKKKAPKGTITIALSQKNGSKVELLISDDGSGIDVHKVRLAALKVGVVSDEETEKLNDQRVLSLIFQSGVSTSPIITDISGRGLGLAIVREKVEKLGGIVAVETKPDAGTVFRLVLPLTLASFRGTLVRAGERVFVLPTTHVERVVKVKKHEIQTAENRETIPLNGQVVSLVHLVDALELPRSAAIDDPADTAPAVILGFTEKRVAFLVDEVLNEQEVLVKTLGKQLARVRNVSGATVLGTGQVVPILNVSDLIKSAVRAAGAPAKPSVEPGERAEKRSVLVVEDSITARTLLKNILEAAGYDVKTAVDGIDGFTQLRSIEFDIVVSDVDMPRMNGFDFTAKIRGDKKLSDLPVVLVTALESREDRERGIDVGANAYIVKSSFDQSNLLEVIRRLI